MEVQRGTYRTRNGQTAHVWERGQIGQDPPCWRGTVKDGGLNEWNDDGTERYGTTAWDLAVFVRPPAPAGGS